jgi:hypothetical protein
MSVDALYLCSLFFASAPFLAIVSILAYYVLRRAVWRQGKRLGWKSLGYYPSSLALGMALQFMQVFHRPSTAYVLEARQNEDVEEDDEGDPENLRKQLHRQLRRIRRGEPVDQLVLRL